MKVAIETEHTLQKMELQGEIIFIGCIELAKAYQYMSRSWFQIAWAANDNIYHYFPEF